MRRANEPPQEVTVRRHPPERLIRAMARGEVAQAGCSCCCCCCLHSLGGLVGAALYSPSGDPPASPDKPKPTAGLADDELDRPVGPPTAPPRAPSIFWSTTAALAILGFVIPPVIWERSGPSLGLSALILGLPAFLLGGSVITALVIIAIPSLSGDAREWKRLGRITLGNIVGTLIGIGLMLLIGLACRR